MCHRFATMSKNSSQSLRFHMLSSRVPRINSLAIGCRLSKFGGENSFAASDFTALALDIEVTQNITRKPAESRVEKQIVSIELFYFANGGNRPALGVHRQQMDFDSRSLSRSRLLSAVIIRKARESLRTHGRRQPPTSKRNRIPVQGQL